MSEPGKRPQIVERARWFQLTEAASVGIEMAAAIGVGAFLGMYLQNHVTHWAPWTTLIGLGIGLSAAVLAVLRTARNFGRVIAAEEAEEAARAAAAGSETAAHSHGPDDDSPDDGETR
jgi:F0F1-type ATP synthase assembly protein I